MRTFSCGAEHAMASVITKFIAGLSANLYEGWSDAKDERFASQTKFLWVAESSTAPPLAATRMIQDRVDGEPALLPLETGFPRIRLPRNGWMNVEMSGRWAKDKRAEIVLYRDLTFMLLGMGVRHVFVLADRSQIATSSMTVGMMGFERWLGKSVTFGDFLHNDTHAPVVWGVERTNRPRMEQSLRRFEHLLGPSQPVIELR
jgi:hypothetical protein